MAMPMYAIGLLPLMQKAASSSAAQHIWFAEDSTAAGRMRTPRVWWNTLEEEGHKYGYVINGATSTLLVKPQFVKTAEEVFHGTTVAIMQDGCRHLDAGLGTTAFCKQSVAVKVTEWPMGEGTASPHQVRPIASTSSVHGVHARAEGQVDIPRSHHARSDGEFPATGGDYPRRVYPGAHRTPHS